MKVLPRILWILIAVALLTGLCVAVAYAMPAEQDQTAPEPPAAKLEILAVPGNIKDANAITGTVKYLTDTVVGPKTATVALFSSGLPNVPISVPVHLSVTAADPASKVMTATWTLTAPPGSQAKIKDSKSLTVTEFTPDLVGAYKVDVVLENASGKGELDFVTLHAGTYVGETAGNCKQCHPGIAAAAAKTGHYRIESDLIDNKRTPDVATHYAETCVRCHTTGYYPGAANGGYADAEAKANYTLPTFKAIDAAGKGGASNFAAMPAAVKNMANIQCESCHGPAGEHVAKGAKMSGSMDSGVCDQCHNGGGHHLKGTDLQASAHSAKTDLAWTVPVGPAEQACVRCHSGAGYVSFLSNPKNMAEWDNSMQTVGCSTCHDPHSDANVWQLRIVGKPVAITFDAKDQGLSATCTECHNNRTQPANAVKGSYPHYSSAAEALNDTGGVDYGLKLPASPHALMVGQTPVANPAAVADDPESAKFLFSKPGDATGQKPGPCVACHMYPTPSDRQGPGRRRHAPGRLALLQHGQPGRQGRVHRRLQGLPQRHRRQLQLRRQGRLRRQRQDRRRPGRGQGPARRPVGLARKERSQEDRHRLSLRQRAQGCLRQGQERLVQLPLCLRHHVGRGRARQRGRCLRHPQLRPLRRPAPGLLQGPDRQRRPRRYHPEVAPRLPPGGRLAPSAGCTRTSSLAKETGGSEHFPPPVSDL